MSTETPACAPRLRTARREEETVTRLELFFDLVFVLAFTQCTALMADDPAWSGLAKGLLVLGVLLLVAFVPVAVEIPALATISVLAGLVRWRARPRLPATHRSRHAPERRDVGLGVEPIDRTADRGDLNSLLRLRDGARQGRHWRRSANLLFLGESLIAASPLDVERVRCSESSEVKVVFATLGGIHDAHRYRAATGSPSL